MKVLIAPDSFKGSCSSIQVARHIEAGVKRVYPSAETVVIPIADGGEGTVEALVAGAGGTYHTFSVTGPMGEQLDAVMGVLDNGIAVIEMAAASGLPLVPLDRRDPGIATTYGTGELIRKALDLGCTQIVLGLGGSATNDGGIGMAQALGVSFRDEDGAELPFGGGSLDKLAHIDLSGLDKRIKDITITAASDVSNPLCGETGASAIFGPQKGADPQMVLELDKKLAHLAQIVKAQLGIDVADVPGAGAAGGLGYGLLAFLGGKVRSGIETVLDTVDADRYLKNCDLVITGEGRIDGQSIFGKVPVGVAQRAKKYNLPVLAIVGGIGPGAEAVYEYGMDSIMSTVNSPMPLKEAMDQAGPLLEQAAERAARMIQIGKMIATEK